jgi:hypothetical protein
MDKNSLPDAGSEHVSTAEEVVFDKEAKLFTKKHKIIIASSLSLVSIVTLLAVAFRRGDTTSSSSLSPPTTPRTVSSPFESLSQLIYSSLRKSESIIFSYRKPILIVFGLLAVVGIALGLGFGLSANSHTISDASMDGKSGSENGGGNGGQPVVVASQDSGATWKVAVGVGAGVSALALLVVFLMCGFGVFGRERAFLLKETEVISKNFLNGPGETSASATGVSADNHPKTPSSDQVKDRKNIYYDRQEADIELVLQLYGMLAEHVRGLKFPSGHTWHVALSPEECPRADIYIIEEVLYENVVDYSPKIYCYIDKSLDNPSTELRGTRPIRTVGVENQKRLLISLLTVNPANIDLPCVFYRNREDELVLLPLDEASFASRLAAHKASGVKTGTVSVVLKAFNIVRNLCKMFELDVDNITFR